MISVNDSEVAIVTPPMEVRVATKVVAILATQILALTLSHQFQK